MTNTILFDLQAAAMAAAANSGQKLPGAEDIPEGGSTFSEILALQNSQNAQMSQTGMAEAAGESVETEAIVEANPDDGPFAEALKRIENSDDAVKKALTLLLKTVLNAMRGTSDGEERKTDMFMILSDGSAGFSDEDDLLSEDILLGAEIMNRLGIMLETAEEKETEPDVLLGELEKIISAILGTKDDEDSDETTAADALAAMLNIPPEEIESLEAADSETKAEAVGNAAEALRAPMEAIRQEAPEKVPEAEKLYSEFAAEVVTETEEVPETPVRAGFSALKINNASEQVNNIGKKISVETEEIAPEQTVETKAPAAETDLGLTEKEKPEEEMADDRADEIAALGAETESVFVRGDIRTEKTETELRPETARSVEAQVKEVVTDEISEFGDKDGVKELVLILRPKELGQVAVKLVKEANTVSVIMSAQYGEVGKLMSQRAAYLSESLSSNNYEVKDVQIVEPGNAAEQMGLNFTDHGFSFARNSANSDGSENGRGRRGENDGYGEIDGIDEIAADHGEIRLREAKLWTTA